MADFGIFVGFGNPHPGREAASTKVFEEALAYWTGLKAAGEIESFETVLLGAHGGDLSGFFLLRGEAEPLARVRMSPEFARLTFRATAVVESLGVVTVLVDAAAIGEVSKSYQAIVDLI
jgi:hypothetical protein